MLKSYSEVSAVLMKDSSDLHFTWTGCKPSAPLQRSISLQHAESQLTTPLLSDIIALIQAALDLMFVCLFLIGLTSDVVCVWLYYRGCVVISKP